MVRKIESLASESETLHAYLREIANFPNLTPDVELQLGRQIQQHGDEAALGQLVQANLRFVAGYVGRFRYLGVPLLDLIHEGNLALIEAARQFDPARAATFQGYALWWVRQAVMHLLAETPRVPDVTAAGLMAAAVAGRQVDALRVALDCALKPAANADEAVERDPLVPMRRRSGRRARRRALALERADVGMLQSLQRNTVLRSYLN